MRRWSYGLIALAVVGLVFVIVGGDILDPIGIVLAGSAAVGGVSLAFYAVGRSEDRAREAEAAAREPQPPAAERPGDGRITARRPPRSRGDS
jgi:threonine/homoserine efflux transporter RhtA